MKIRCKKGYEDKGLHLRATVPHDHDLILGGADGAKEIEIDDRDPSVPDLRRQLAPGGGLSTHFEEVK